MYRSILVAVDGSEYSAKAVKHAGLLAKMSGAKLVLFYAAPHVHMPPYTDGLEVGRVREVEDLAKSARDVQANKLLTDARKDLGFADLPVEQGFAVSGNPYEAILEAAKNHDCDLIVMAPHGHHGIAGILLGSETQKVLTHSKVPVLVVH